MVYEMECDPVLRQKEPLLKSWGSLELNFVHGSTVFSCRRKKTRKLTMQSPQLCVLGAGKREKQRIYCSKAAETLLVHL